MNRTNLYSFHAFAGGGVARYQNNLFVLLLNTSKIISLSQSVVLELKSSPPHKTSRARSQKREGKK